MTKLRWLKVHMGAVEAGHPFLLRQHGDEPYAYILQKWIEAIYEGETGEWVDVPVLDLEKRG